MQYKKYNAWGVLLRLYHWCFAISIIVLVATGFYIANPLGVTDIETNVSFIMANIRYIHFVAAFVFTASVFVRLYLLLFGNRQERFWDFLPITPRNIKNFFSTLLYYHYLSDKHDSRLGHNTLAGCLYILTLFVAIIQALTGFYMLYPENQTWQKLGLDLFGTQQQARFLHHMLMWYFILFALIHLYIVIWNDIKNPEGLISSIFNGKKFMPADKF